MSAPTTHSYRRLIRFADTDAAGVAHFSRLLVIVEEALHDFFQHRGVSILDEASAWPFVSIHADYKAGCRFGDEIIVAFSLSQMRTSSLTVSFEATRKGGPLCFCGTATLCHVNPSKNTPTPIPTKTRDALGPR
jgi:YbgC/YbaW family acyl-CoA thioester hydrolase